MTYNLKPIDTKDIQLPTELQPLVDFVAEHNHDVWAKQRIAGWAFGARPATIMSSIIAV